MQQFLYINWNPDLFAFQIGSWGLRWYSICWFIGLASAFFIVKWLYNHQNITFQERVYGKEKTKINVFEPLFIYCFLGILAGARLGHCIFYQPEYFLTSF